MPKQRLTRRGWIVLGAVALVLLWFVSTQLWFTADGLCVGDVIKCVYGGK